MLYEEFEKLNCQHIKELDSQKVINHRHIIDNVNECQKDSVLENDLFRKPFAVNGSCALKGIQDNTVTPCYGFDCPNTDFYQPPDRLNTYHNYLVLQDDLKHNIPVSCTENHQYYHNWTRRKMPVKKEPISANINFFDNYLEPIPIVKMRSCKVEKKDYTC